MFPGEALTDYNRPSMPEPDISAVPTQPEISQMLDELHGEIMKNREMWGLFSDRLQVITRSNDEPKNEQPTDPMLTDLGCRIRDMRDYLRQTNEMFWVLHQSIQL